MKKLLALLLVLLMAFALASCGEKEATQSDTTASSEPQTSEPAGAEEKPSAVPTENCKVKDSNPALDQLKSEGYDVSQLPVPRVTYADVDFDYQLQKPQKGDTIAVIHTSMGDISLRLFPEFAPNTVNNFIKLSEQGKYDGVLFHRVIDNFMIQGGDYENGDGTGGKSIYGDAFEDEFCDKLLNIRGSVAMANSGSDTNGSQFFINQNSSGDLSGSESFWKSIKGYIKDYKTDAASLANVFNNAMSNYGYNALTNADSLPDGYKKIYKENGGNPGLDGAYNVVDRGHAVFAQVIDGMDVVDSIAAVNVDMNNKPVEDVTIKSVEIKKYE